MPTIWNNPGMPGQDTPGAVTLPGWLNVGMEIVGGLIDIFSPKQRAQDTFQVNDSNDDGIITGDNNFNLFANPLTAIAVIGFIYLILKKR